jgi:protease-4
MTDTEEDKKINFVSIKKYTAIAGKGGDTKSLDDYKNKVAVVYASGEIRSGENESDIMGSETISEAIALAREDDNVKAVVLRVNSPGGSSLASDVIWREVMLTREVKPVVVSMGNLAASGGYYISCGADKIIADENTITGSIGVFGMIPNAQGFFNNKLGITFDTVNTNKNADLFSMTRKIKPVEVTYITMLIERIYKDFVTKVSDGRNMSYTAVDSIGQGRVWSGSDALKIGLVDEIGGLNRAIEVAAELGEVEKYRLLELPEQKDPFQELISQFTENVEVKMAKKHFGNYYHELAYIHRSFSDKGIYMRLPFDFILE